MRKLTEVLTPEQVQDAMIQQVLHGRLEDLAARRIADPAERTTFVEEESSRTEEQKQAAEDIAVLLAKNPTR